MYGLMKECECQKRWRRMTRIGSGAYGSAYHACSVSNSKDCEYVVKVQSNNATAKRELIAYMRLSGSSVVPKMHAAWLCRGRMYIVLDRMFECKVSLKDLKHVLNRFLRLGWLHVDVHPGNVMCNKKGNICLIDLGWAVHKDDQPYKGHARVLENILSMF
jgi:RIO-like serine/threonine protein kinase